ncbi:cytochrome P450 [Polyplosphaeria fusca]|uniref:Cytochrome P450 n=1 Tax=Polyplosphaeria fusca TaxID=682080 RepID=A0A9P4QUQ9_9PLEO|nr:cytochrome P450 [Polyplosphaeria fusca]
MIVSSSTVLLVFVAVSTLYVVARLLRRQNKHPLPPGPKGIPLLGNVNDMPKPGMLECHHWLKHKDLYGPISSVTVLGQTFVIINDAQIALELMRDRSVIYSSRPGQIFSGEMVGWRYATAMLPYTDLWKIHRKNITKIVTTKESIAAFERVQEVEAVHFVLNLLQSPDDWFDHIRKEAGSVILKIIYGYTTEARGRDPLVDMAQKTADEFADATVPGRFIVDILPFLRYLPEWCPGAGFQTTARRMAAQLRHCTDQPYEFVKKQMREETHKTSFLSQAIQDIGTDAKMESIHKWTALSMYLGGADTTVSSLMTFFLAMIIYPDVQKRAQEEIDRVIGHNRLPAISDRDKLPYIVAVMKETHRWHPVLPMCVPHSSIEEDVFRGYRIPKGSLLIANNWLFTHDPSVFPDPMTFRPERHLDMPDHQAEPDPRDFIFGYGRRICPGRFVADNAVFITIAQTLAVFNIEKPVDENGTTVEPRVEFESGTLSRPLPFRASIEPRSKIHEQLIKAAENDYPWEPSDAKELETAKW